MLQNDCTVWCPRVDESERLAVLNCPVIFHVVSVASQNISIQFASTRLSKESLHRSRTSEVPGPEALADTSICGVGMFPIRREGESYKNLAMIWGKI